MHTSIPPFDRQRALLPTTDKPALLPSQSRSAPLRYHELEAFAAFLAVESDIALRIHTAVEHDVAWYQAQVGSDLCSVADAAVLRLWTIDLCRSVNPPKLPTIASPAALLQMPSVAVPDPRDRVGGFASPIRLEDYDARDLIDDDKATLDDHLCGLCLVAVLVAALLLYWWISPTDRELQDINYGRSVAAAVIR